MNYHQQNEFINDTNQIVSQLAAEIKEINNKQQAVLSGTYCEKYGKVNNIDSKLPVVKFCEIGGEQTLYLMNSRI
jgi:hypothetical protein